ncbi:MAG TPA: D-aminoacylase [Bacillota bacterium]|nr:D-aminoacylase [Bacillota bacterium]
MLDIKITGARIYDGSGNAWFPADIGIQADRIAVLGDLAAAEARRTIDAARLAVCPGFIDIHSHSDRTLLTHPLGIAGLLQGITTQVGGNCGHSPGPVEDSGAAVAEELREAGGEDPGLRWSSFAEHLECLEKVGIGNNLAMLVGHGSIRRRVMGPEGKGGERPHPTTAELEAMSRELAEALEAGAFGLSTGLEYPPGRNARAAELIALCRVVAAHDGLYSSHLRSEGQAPGCEWFGAVVEALETGRSAGVRVNISHLKADQRAAWWKAPGVLRLLEDARRRGLTVTADVYPYPYAATGYLYQVMPPDLIREGRAGLVARLGDAAARREVRRLLEAGVPGWTNPAVSFGWGAIGIVETSSPADQGKSVEDLAIERNADPLDVCLDLLVADGGRTRSSVGVMDEDNIRRNLQHPLTMVSTDGATVDSFPAAPPGGEPPAKLHPRSVSTYPRLLGRYVREGRALAWAEAIRKSTSLPASVAGIPGRGRIRPGFFADLVVFDPDTICETATFADPHRHPTGISWVLVNGRLAVDGGVPTRVRAGRVLRRGG